jgi:hypothetical protein
MIQNIFVGIIAVIAIGAGVWTWLSDIRNTGENTSEKEKINPVKESDKGSKSHG